MSSDPPYTVLPQKDTVKNIPPKRKLSQFYDALKPVLYVQCLFGQCYLSNSLLLLLIVKLLFMVMLSYLMVMFVLAVFKRDGIEVWVQFSLYIIPLLSFPCGAYVFSSSAYYRMLKRNLTSSSAVLFYLNRASKDGEGNCKSAAHNIEWLREISYKSFIYPIVLEILQWGTFLIFYFQNDNPDHFLNNFVGNVVLFNNKDIWKWLYILNWCIAVYIVGFVSYQFVFVTRLIVKDTVNLMSLFGKTSYLKLYPVYNFALKHNIIFRFFRGIVNFITMDLFNSYSDERIYTDSAELLRDNSDHLPTYPFMPTRVLTSPFGVKRELSPDIESNHNQDNEYELEIESKISPSEACEIFSTFIADVEALTSVFMPFMIVLTFFGIANLITHVGLFIKSDGGHHLTSWTLFRTILFLLVALRMIVCVHIVSSTLGKLPPHINLIRTAGKLGHENDKSPNWKDFIDLLSTYHLGKRSFGFPMTLRQIASFVTVINMAFLIVFSVMSHKSDK